MSRKFSYIPLALIVIVGAVWAGSMITPDKPGFPSLPSSAGTLGYVLEAGRYFRSDGTAMSGAALGGTGAQWYAKVFVCSDPETWRGIDASGNAICKWPPLAFAEIIEWTLQVNGTVQPIGTKLREWDRIITDATQTGTIRFYDVPGVSPSTAGISIARIGTGSQVYITRGDTAGTLALVELEEWLLWWRVLTSTGINFGGGGVVAGVRGTSIAMEKIAGNLEYRLIIPHSHSSTNAAKFTLKQSNTDDELWIWDSTASAYSSWTNSLPSVEARDLFSLYGTGYTDRRGLSKWIRENTLLDINYLSGMTAPGVIPTMLMSTAIGEINSTKPDSPRERYDLCKKDTPDKSGYWYEDGQYGCVLAYADASTNYDLKWTQNISPTKEWEILAKQKLNWIVWTTVTANVYNNANFLSNVLGLSGFNWLIRYTPLNQAFWTDYYKYNIACDESGSFEARTNCKRLAGYKGIMTNSGSIPKTIELVDGFYWNNNSQPQTDNIAIENANPANDETNRFTFPAWTRNQPHPNSLSITQSGQYITYVGDGQSVLDHLRWITPSPSSYAWLAGKTITIELSWEITTTNTPLLVLTPDASQMFYTDSAGVFKCVPAASWCSATKNGRIYTMYLGTMSPSLFLIWNRPDGTKPIGRSIEKILLK
jgi:hypothetical protein